MKLPFRIEKRDSFRVVGYRIQTTNKGKEGKKMIPAQWKEFPGEGTAGSFAAFDESGALRLVWNQRL